MTGTIGELKGQRPITFSLDADVLWRIFSFNTFSDEDFTEPTSVRRTQQINGESDEEDEISSQDSEFYVDDETEFSLITARHTSQVCVLWREIMLASPNIWSNTINISHLQQKDDGWRSEVLRRTGTSLLSLIGHGLCADNPGNAFFFSLLRSEGGRIRRISTFTTSGFGGVGDDPRWKSIFFHPAPQLEILRFQFRRARRPGIRKIGLNRSKRNTPFPKSHSLLFVDKAPKIHTLILGGVQAYLPGTWISGIQRLEIQDSDVQDSLLPSLDLMPNLKVLRLREAHIEHNAERSRVRFSHLRAFHLDSDIYDAPNLLESIELTERCSSNINIKEGMYGVDSSGPLESRFRQIITSQMRNRFAKHICLKITEDFIHLSNHAGSYASIHSSPEPLEISFDYVMDTLPRLLLDILSELHTKSITGVFFEISTPWYRDPLDDSIDNLFDYLKSVETLHTRCSYLELLTERLQGPEGGILSFPNLHTLVLEDKDSIRTFPNQIMGFIDQRRSVGFPLRKIDVSNCIGLNDDVLGNLMDSIEGLEVVMH